MIEIDRSGVDDTIVNEKLRNQVINQKEYKLAYLKERKIYKVWVEHSHDHFDIVCSYGEGPGKITSKWRIDLSHQDSIILHRKCTFSMFEWGIILLPLGVFLLIYPCIGIASGHFSITSVVFWVLGIALISFYYQMFYRLSTMRVRQFWNQILKRDKG